MMRDDRCYGTRSNVTLAADRHMKVGGDGVTSRSKGVIKATTRIRYHELGRDST